MRVSGRAIVAGVVGHPVGHSLSPRIHGHWLEALGIDGAYVPLAVRKDAFSTALHGLRTAGFVGINVTVPHKIAAFAVAHEHDEAARASGAVNLLLFRGDRLEGRNTDVAGLAASLAEGLGADALENKIAIVLGAGGAARAAVLALQALRVREIRVIARNAAQREALERSIGTLPISSLVGYAWSDWPSAAFHAALLVNATSAGMKGTAPLALSLDPLPTDAAVCDIVYNPLETALLKDARARGLKTIDGLGMLMHQAVPAFEAFYGVRPVVTSSLRAELEGALRGAS